MKFCNRKNNNKRTFLELIGIFYKYLVCYFELCAVDQGTGVGYERGKGDYGS